jgi:hypothetical protein
MTVSEVSKLRDIAMRWIEARRALVNARDAGAEANIFQSNPGTHMNFLKVLQRFTEELTGVYASESFSPEVAQALSELTANWYHNLQNRAISK